MTNFVPYTETDPSYVDAIKALTYEDANWLEKTGWPDRNLRAGEDRKVVQMRRWMQVYNKYRTSHDYSN